jgi:hypothetical protein
MGTLSCGKVKPTVGAVGVVGKDLRLLTEGRHSKYKRLKLGGGNVYDCSSI